MNYALLCSCEAKPKQKSSLLYPPFSFSWVAEGVSTYEASPSFASCYALATAEGRPSPFLLAAASAATQKPSPTPLHVKGSDIALLTQSVASLNQI